MELLNFMNAHLDDWEEILTAEPYCLKVSKSGPYVLLKYQQFISDMSYEICREARGAIFRKNNGDLWSPVSVAMYKFFNAAEPLAAKIDWNTAVVQEKVDGSLIKFGYDWEEKHWLISTNGTIHAADAHADENYNYGNLVCAALCAGKNIGGNTPLDYRSFIGGVRMLEEFLMCLDENYCYYFELVSPLSRIVCSYPRTRLYYLGRRNMLTMEEDATRIEFPYQYYIQYPKTYNLSSLSDCYAAANELGENAEGYVVRDANFNRVKIKSPWYLAMHKLRGNGRLSIKTVVEYWKQEILDDYVGQFPEHAPFIHAICNNLLELHFEMTSQWHLKYNRGMERKEFALAIKDLPSIIQAYLFKRFTNTTLNAMSYIKQIPNKTLVDYLSSKMTIHEVGVTEDA